MDDNNSFREFGLIGWPLEYSLSPFIHTEFFRFSGLRGEYRLYPASPERFEDTVSNLLEKGVRGLNITYPHKAAARRICREIEGDAAEIGVINTIHIIDGKNVGYNTDTDGFNHLLALISPPEPFFIVGAGGAALAVDFVLNRSGAESRVFCRNPAGWKGISAAGELEEVGSAIRETCGGTVVNATTLGWKSDDSYPIDLELMKDMFFIDLNYNRFWKWRNLLDGYTSEVFTGEAMLVFQAAKSFQIWTGVKPETERVLRMVREKLEQDSGRIIIDGAD